MIIKTANHRRKTTVKVRTFRILKKKKKGRNRAFIKKEKNKAYWKNNKEILYELKKSTDSQ